MISRYVANKNYVTERATNTQNKYRTENKYSMTIQELEAHRALQEKTTKLMYSIQGRVALLTGLTQT